MWALIAALLLLVCLSGVVSVVFFASLSLVVPGTCCCLCCFVACFNCSFR